MEPCQHPLSHHSSGTQGGDKALSTFPFTSISWDPRWGRSLFNMSPRFTLHGPRLGTEPCQHVSSLSGDPGWGQSLVNMSLPITLWGPRVGTKPCQHVSSLSGDPGWGRSLVNMSLHSPGTQGGDRALSTCPFTLRGPRVGTKPCQHVPSLHFPSPSHFIPHIHVHF